MRSILYIYSDASIPDQPQAPKGLPPRRQVAGEAFIAWCGWHEGYAQRHDPTFTGEAYIGIQGIQRAEFQAAIHALSAAAAYIWPRVPDRRPDCVILRTDCRDVVRLMDGHGQADILYPYLLAALAVRKTIQEDLQVPVMLELVNVKTDPMLKAVDGRTRQAAGRVGKRQGGWPEPPGWLPF